MSAKKTAKIGPMIAYAIMQERRLPYSIVGLGINKVEAWHNAECEMIIESIDEPLPKKICEICNERQNRNGLRCIRVTITPYEK